MKYVLFTQLLLLERKSAEVLVSDVNKFLLFTLIIFKTE